MSKQHFLQLALTGCVFAAGFFFGHERGAAAAGRVFELRTYTASEGKFADLQARFRNHTLRIFEKHGMKNIGYWIPQDPKLSQNTLIYLLAYPGKDAAQKSWQDFRNDPEWKKVQAESEVNGRLVSKVDSVYMDPADFSPMK
ncbi:MAG: NIPSNAP family protein [Acidobacteria bacterium]|nr:NIPSNAP family protein [Acidobacteriota bacterium]